MIFDKDDFKAYDADLWNAIAKEEERHFQTQLTQY